MPDATHDYDWSQWSKEELMELVRAMDDEDGIVREVMRDIAGVN